MGGPMACPAMAVMPPQSFMLDRLAETLQLSAAQLTKLKEIAAKSDQTVRTLSQKAAEASKAVRTSLFASDFDAQKVKDLAATAQTAEAAIISASIDEWAQIRANLSADQAAKLQELMSMRGPGAGPGPGGPPPPGGEPPSPEGAPLGPPPPPPGQ